MTDGEKVISKKLDQILIVLQRIACNQANLERYADGGTGKLYVDFFGPEPRRNEGRRKQ